MTPALKPIKILIVDDSRIFRSAIQEVLSHEKDIEIIGSVWNGIKALEFIESSPPDLVTLDVQMPDMDGLQTLQAIQEINAKRSKKEQIGVIMLSSHTKKGADITVQALEMGAFDFISKPEKGDLRDNIINLCQQLTVKIRQYTDQKAATPIARKRIVRPPEPPKEEIPSFSVGINAIVIGVSTGGPKALAEILPPLCDTVEVPIFIVQHMPPTFTESLARSLDAKCRYTISEGTHNGVARKRHAYIAPGGRHMELIRDNVENNVRIIINDDPPLKGCRPSVDILFDSAADVYGRNIIAVILTGMGTDGTSGAKSLKSKGARIVAQDEASSVVWGMPGSVINAGLADHVFSLKEIPQAIVAMMKKQGTAVI